MDVNQIKRIREATGLGQQAFAEALGVERHTIVDMERGKQRVTVEMLLLIKDHFHFDGNWLLTGEGKPAIACNDPLSPDYGCLVQCSPPGNRELVGENSLGTGILDNYALIVELTFGGKGESSTNGDLMTTKKKASHAIRLDLLSRLGMTIDDAAMILMPGDNMVPTMYDGDMVVVDLRVNQMVGPAIYAFVAGGMTRVSRMFPTINGSVSILNDNPAYPQERIDNCDLSGSIEILGKAVWVCKKL